MDDFNDPFNKFTIEDINENNINENNLVDFLQKIVNKTPTDFFFSDLESLTIDFNFNNGTFQTINIKSNKFLIDILNANSSLLLKNFSIPTYDEEFLCKIKDENDELPDIRCDYSEIIDLDVTELVPKLKREKIEHYRLSEYINNNLNKFILILFN